MRKTTMQVTRIVAIAVTLGSLAIFGNTSQADIFLGDTVNIDFGHNLQVTSGNWNNMSGATGSDPTDLADLNRFSDGAATGVGLAYSKAGTGGVAGPGANWNGPYPGGLPTGDGSSFDSALGDGLFFAQNGGTITLTLSGLDDNLLYDFLLYGARGNSGSVDTTYAINGGTPVNIGPVLNNSTNFASFTSVASTGGVITVDATSIGGASNNGGALNIMSFTAASAVPEPGSLLVLGFGAATMVLRRRKR
jgi:hypothetical protein